MRTQVQDLQKVNLGGAASPVSAGVSRPSVATTNKALALADALKGTSRLIGQVKEQKDIDIKKATDAKLKGSAHYVDSINGKLSTYEDDRATLMTEEQANAYYLEKTREDFDDPHLASGYNERRMQGLESFLRHHSDYLSKRQLQERSDSMAKDYVLTADTQGVAQAEARKNQVAKNYQVPPKDLNATSLMAARILASQGKYDQASEVLQYKRGAAGSLIDHPDTAEEAKDLFNRIDAARDAANMVEEQRQAEQKKLEELHSIAKTNDFVETLGSAKNYADKVTILNQMAMTNQIDQKTLKEATSYLRKSKDVPVDKLDTKRFSDLASMVYHNAVFGDPASEEALKSGQNVRKQIMQARANGEINDQQETLLHERMTAVSGRGKLEARKFADAQSAIMRTVPEKYQAEVMQELFYNAEEPEEIEADLYNPYLTKGLRIADEINQKRRTDALNAMRNEPQGYTPEEESLMAENGITAEDIQQQARQYQMDEAEVMRLLREQL